MSWLNASYRLFCSMLTLTLASTLLGCVSALIIPSRIQYSRDIKIVDHNLASGELFYHLGNTSYFTPTKYPKASYAVFGKSASSPPAPAAAFKIYSDVTAKDMESVVGGYYEKDDVFAPEYMATVFVYALNGSPVIHQDILTYLASIGTQTLITSDNIQVNGSLDNFNIVVVESTTDCPEGPLVITVNDTSVSFYPTYKLEHDRYRTFVFGAYPAGDGSGDFIAFDRVTTEFEDPWIPVPSRLYSTGNNTLTGERIAVKDIYDVQGLQTSAGSRAYAEIYPVALANSVPVQRLMDLGGVIVGKTKTAQFASGASTNDETLDVQYPFSPRSDGWQSCGASSSGSGCAMAAYNWLDYAIGSDTGGSVRVPAAISGLYGNRPTVGAISLKGVIPLGEAFDTAGVLSRDPYKWIKFAKAWYEEGGEDFQEYSSFPKRLIYPTNYFPIGGAEGQAIQEDFLQKMQSLLGMERVELNVTQEILNAGFNFTSINAASRVLNLWNQWTKVGKPLSDAYAAANEGRFPPLDTARRVDWPAARDTENQTQYDNALPIIDGFRDWFNNHFIPYDNQTCAESIYVYDIGTGGLPAYREKGLNDGINAYSPFNDTRGNPLGKTSVSPDAGCVDITIPLGQAAYQSNVTHITEYHPVTISLLTRTGCDYMLFNLVEALADAGLITSVKTGRTAYSREGEK